MTPNLLPGFDKIPPHLKQAYAKVVFAKERGDERAAALATVELEKQLQAMPPEFKSALQPLHASKKSGSRGTSDA